MQSIYSTYTSPYLIDQPPSITQYISQQKFNDLLSPALRSLLTILAHRFPRIGLRLLNYNDELFTFFMLIVQRYYLRVHQSSLSESFYGLKRKRSEIFNRSYDMNSADINWSLFFLVIVPYLKTKLDLIHDELYSNQGGGFLVPEQDPSQSHHWKQRLEQFLLKVYPYVHASFVGSQVIYLLLHAFNKSYFFSPFLHYMQLRINSVTSADLLDIQRKSQGSQSSTHISRALTMMKAFIPYTIFGYNFIEWYLATDRGKLGPIKEKFPPPPPNLSPHPSGLALPSDLSVCPLCTCKINNPTAIPTGYVFCYVCIFNFVSRHSHCPVTLKQVQPSDLCRIFQTDV